MQEEKQYQDLFYLIYSTIKLCKKYNATLKPPREDLVYHSMFF